MLWPSDFNPAQWTTIALVLVRVASLVMVAPILGTFAVGARVRLVLALALTVMIAPFELARGTPSPEPDLALLVAAGGEALVGLILGLGVRILFCAMHVAGGAISQLGGMQLAEVVNPASGTSVPVYSQLLFCATTAVFLVIGGHRLIVEALMDTFAWLPAGQGSVSSSALDAVTTLVAQSFVLGVRAAAPAMVALLLGTLVVALVSRTLPQLNTLALGLGINALLGLVALGISLGGACWLFQDQIEPMLETALKALKPSEL